MTSTDADRVAPSAIARMDHWRSSPATKLHRLGFKEWHHFYVFGPEVELLVNFSAMNGVQYEPDRGALVPRLALLARTPSGWRGSIERFDPVAVQLDAGSIDAQFGDNRLRFRNGSYELRLADDSAGVHAEIVLEPVTEPAFTEPIRLGNGGSMRWLVVSRLHASGSVEVDGRRHVLRRAPAYHDHDWGSFPWGSGFAWNWSVALADCGGEAWAITATQVTDEGRRRLHTDSLMVWRGPLMVRSFRREGVSTTAHGLFRPPSRPLRIPPAAWLAAPSEAFDIPRTYSVRAASHGDVVDLHLETVDFAQIAIPADLDDDVVCTLSEIRAEFAATATIRGERISLQGPAVLELLHVVR